MIALYARVSTKDQGQELETQLQPLRDWAEIQKQTRINNRKLLNGGGPRITDGYKIYTDQASGADLDRPGWRELFREIRNGITRNGPGGRDYIDTLAVLRLDRAFRSVVDMHNVLAELEGRGIRFAAITQPIDTGTPVGKLLITVLGGVAEFERDMISERVKEGLARAKRQGIKLGRKRKPLSSDRAAVYLKEFGNAAAAAAALGVSRSTLYNRIKKRPINLPDVSFLEP